MKEEGGNKTRAAQRLGLDRKTLYRKLEESEQKAEGGTDRERTPERLVERLSDRDADSGHDDDEPV
jgi:transposase-like protein